MPAIFEETTINGLILKNRLVRSATWEGMADARGAVTPRLLALYDTLAKGGVGLIISSYLYIHPGGKQNPDQVGAWDDELIPGLTRLAETVHARGGKLVGQIVHCGGQSNRNAMGGLQPVAPSAVESPGYPEVPHALTAEEIAGLIEDFASAAARLQEAGFDGAQLHGAHGYLLAEFLSPVRNQRQDRYGGSIENRARFTMEVYRAVRERVGPNFPVMIKLNAHDFLEGSTTEDDSAWLAKGLAEAGIDAIEVSGGTPGSGKLMASRTGIKKEDDEAYFLPQAKAIRAATKGTPLMLVGGIRSLEVIERILEAGDADYVSMSRPLIREPDLPARWARGERRRADCISCLGCFGPARKGEGIRCMQVK